MEVNTKLVAVLMLTMASSLVARNVSSQNLVVARPLRLTLSTVPETIYTAKNIPLKLTFQNTGKKRIRILDCFKNPKLLPIIFWFDVRRENGEVVYIPGGGKISFSKDSFKYITLENNEKFDLLINLNDFILPVTERKADMPNTVLKAGTYSILVTYVNQYGEDCYKCFINGNTIKINITE
jgi:hypothetical protein